MAIQPAKSFKRYSLSEVIVSFTSSNSGDDFTFSLGGVGTFFGGVTIAWDTPLWSKEMDATGAGVLSRSYDMSGTVTLTINQMSTDVEIFNSLIMAYMKDPNGIEKPPMLDITIQRVGEGSPMVKASMCVLEKNPDLGYAEAAATREYGFISMYMEPSVKSDSLGD